jgi:hypothetical protein
MKLYKQWFKKRIKGKMHAMFHAADWRKNGELIEFVDDAGNVVQRFSVYDVKGEPFVFRDDDDPQCSILPQE